MIVISKEIKTSGWTAYENWMFLTDRDGTMRARHYVNNRKGTYYSKLGAMVFKTKEEGNEFYKRKRSEGFTR